jgi:hypothetical protein
MGKPRLELTSPAKEKRTVAPRRRSNRELRPREHLSASGGSQARRFKTTGVFLSSSIRHVCLRMISPESHSHTVGKLGAHFFERLLARL